LVIRIDYFWEPPEDGQASSAARLLCRLEINPSKGNLLSVEGAMIDALFNVAIFATLVLCIVGFSAWAHKRVP
jgi:hypothetical protein